MENGTDTADDFVNNFELNSLKDGLKINVSKSSSTEEGSDASSRSYQLWPDSKASPRAAFPLSREILHEQLFGISELRRDVSRSYSTTDVPESINNLDVARASPSALQAPKSSPGIIGANYSPRLNSVTGSGVNSSGNASVNSGAAYAHVLSGSSSHGFGERHLLPTPPPIDVTSRYIAPPALLNVYNQQYNTAGTPRSVSNSFSSSFTSGSTSGASSSVSTPIAAASTGGLVTSFSGKTFTPNVSNPTVAISPSYHGQYSSFQPGGGSSVAGASAVGVGQQSLQPPPPPPQLQFGRSPRISPVGNGRENPNLHYRPNRDVQIANLARAKAAAEAAAAGTTASSTTESGESAADATPAVVTKSRSSSSDSDSSPTQTAASTATNSASGTPPPSVTVSAASAASSNSRKPAIQYVYKVTLKTTAVQCLISPSCSLTALSMNELVVFQTCDEGSGALGEEIGFVSHIQTMKSYLEKQFYVSNEQEAAAASAPLKQIIRVATESDRKETAKNRLEEANIAEQLVEMNNTVYRLPIVIQDVQFQLDRRKLTVCYRETSEGAAASMDGREMMRDLYQRVQTRVVMKRITGSNK